ncbi:hypothetical protein I7I51_06828 [Histoplasma capsulatum]|uniref:Uncharacterized protein n=1 Tax=Ajellomyces capsulatus TaxID=5037 RepID=A0A8A1MPH9_AJECA|nr:hypothetical protein I7I51_06828 [Histoplasma capsulatum]
MVVPKYQVPSATPGIGLFLGTSTRIVYWLLWARLFPSNFDVNSHANSNFLFIVSLPATLRSALAVNQDIGHSSFAPRDLPISLCLALA